MASPRTARIICSGISVFTTAIMILLTALAYTNLDFRNRYYAWLMVIPVVFNLTIAILFGGGCLPPINLSCCKACKTSKQDKDDDPMEIFAVPGVSGYQRYAPSDSSTLRKVSSTDSRSFFASGGSEFTVIANERQPTSKITKMKQTLLSEGPGVYQIKNNPDGSSFLSSVLSPKSAKQQKRGRRTSNYDGLNYTKLINEVQQTSSSTYMPVNRDGTHRSSAKRPKISERVPLLQSHEPISIFEDPKAYGAITKAVQQQYPFPIYGIVPKIPGVTIEIDEDGKPVRTQSMEDTWFSRQRSNETDVPRNNSWPQDYEPPVFHFTPRKQNPKPSQPKVLEMNEEVKVDLGGFMEDEEVKVDLELPTSSSWRKVMDWIKKSPPPKTSKGKNDQTKHPRKATKGKNDQAESPQKTSKGMNDQAKSPQKSKTSDGKSKSKTSKKPTDESEDEQFPSDTNEMNKFCILGRGYFYATETPDYLPVDLSPTAHEDAFDLITSADSIKTITNSPTKDSKGEPGKTRCTSS